MRTPGGIKEVIIGTDSADNEPYLPVDFSERKLAVSATSKLFYIDDESNEIVFLKDIATAGETITIRYYYIPARITSIGESTTFPIPDRYRKTIATLAAAYAQWGRYLDAQGNRLYNMYERLVGKAQTQQSERSVGNIRKMQHPLRWRGFKRVYPR